VRHRLAIFLQRFMRWAEVDRAVLYAVLTKVWAVASGPVTLLLIASYFSPELQGYYYTFNSVLALQVFVELGLTTVVIQFAAHEWSKLDLGKRGEIVGNSVALSRLMSLGQISLKWFTVGGMLVAIGLMIGGYIFFSQSDYPDVHWKWPWILLSIMSGMSVCLLPIWSLLEGCNQVSSVYGFRMSQGILSNVVIWLTVILGAGLWAAGISAAIILVWSMVFLYHRHLPFLRTFISPIRGPRMSWRFEIWPMQWKIGLSWLSGYFTSSIFTPVLFHYHGAVVAGQMGMTWTLIGAVATISVAWVKTKVPRFGVLIANKEYADLDRLFSRIFFVSLVVLLAGAFALWICVYLLNAMSHPMAERLLPPLPSGLFMLACVLTHITVPFSYYLRAHKKEPYLWLNIISGVLTGLSAWFFGSRFGVIGIGIGYLATVVFFTLPYGIIVWYRCRSAWHSDVIGHAVVSSLE